MKVFISSLIGEYGDMRAAARTAIETLRHAPVVAEDFGAKAASPQIACMKGIRESDVVVLLLGESYGVVQPVSGLSATHEEYREARGRGRKPILAFVQSGVVRGPEQQAFLEEVQGWADGVFRSSYSDPVSLQAAVTRALHDHELAKAVAPLDTDEMLGRALALVGNHVGRSRHSYLSGSPQLLVAIAWGPRQSILRPAEIEAASLSEGLHRDGLFGEARIFDGTRGIKKSIDGDALVIAEEGQTLFRLDEMGSVLLKQTLPRPPGDMHFPVIIEESIGEAIATALAFAAATLEAIDRTQRLTHVAVAVMIEGSDHLAWKTRKETNEAGNSMSVSMGYGEAKKPVTEVKSRPALRLERGRIVEDVVVKLRRTWQSR